MQKEKTIEETLEALVLGNYYDHTDDIRTFFFYCKMLGYNQIDFTISSSSYDTSVTDVFLINSGYFLTSIDNNYISEFLLDWFDSLSNDLMSSITGNMDVYINLKNMTIKCRLEREIVRIEKRNIISRNIFKDEDKIKETLSGFRD